jgi:hypothetical protein
VSSIPHGLAIALLLVACLLIAIGRRRTRSAWREVADGRRGRARWKKFSGWVVVLAGGLFMIAGVLAW